MKDFDPDRIGRQADEDTRTFKLGGETFVIRAAIRPDVLAGYDDIGDDTSTVETLRILDDLLVNLIEPDFGNNGGGIDATDRYLALRERTEDPIELTDILDVVNWVVEVYTARPTGKPSDSGTGRSGTGTPSTVVSSLPGTPTALAV